MTVETLAERLDLSTSALRRYRQGTRGVPPALLTRLAKAMRKQAKVLEAMANRLDNEASSRKGD